MKQLKAFNMVELMIVAGLMLTTVIFCLPVIFNNSKEARIIAGWKKLYTEIQSNFEVFEIADRENVLNVCNGEMTKQKQAEIFQIFAPYLNVDSDKSINSLKFYHYKFKNGAQVPMNSPVFTRLFAYQDKGTIVGFKWLDCHCSETEPCATILFDMNGTKKPNRIGKDIFGIYLYKNRIETFGSDLPNNELSRKCLEQSNGMCCSEYYLRGGRF